MKRIFTILVRGKTKEWCFNYVGDTRDYQGWIDDGLDVGRVLNIIPLWVVNLGLTRTWCFLQDIFQFR